MIRFGSPCSNRPPFSPRSRCAVDSCSASDLGADQILVARIRRQRFAEPKLRESCAVERRGVEVADAAVPGRVDRGDRFIVRDVAIHVAERRRAEADA
jgi:hypothetical protein